MSLIARSEHAPARCPSWCTDDSIDAHTVTHISTKEVDLGESGDIWVTLVRPDGLDSAGKTLIQLAVNAAQVIDLDLNGALCMAKALLDAALSLSGS